MKTKVALITGRYTGGAEVSFKSAAFVQEQLDKEKYDIYPITITQESWFHITEAGVKVTVNRENFSLLIDEHVLTFDVAFIMLHGAPGEDGRLQGYLDMVGLPYTSCGTLTSALTMNKEYTKAVLASIPDLHVAKSVLLFDAQRQEAPDIVQQNLHLPYFVKPNAGGSSIGMSKVKEPTELPEALEKAFDAANTG